MKKILFFLFALTTMVISANAQRLISTNGDSRFGKSLRTTDSTFRSIDSVVVNTNEAGVLEFTVIGLDTANNKAITAAGFVRYVRAAGTITVGSVEETSTKVVDSGLSPANYQFTSSGNKIYLQIKGKLTVNVHWYTSVKRKSVFKR
jgi:hypothetical protein